MLWLMKKSFSSASKNDLTTYNNIWKIATGQRNDYTTACLLDCNYVQNYYNMIVIYSSKQQALGADPKGIQ